MPTLLKVYSNNQPNPVLCGAIQFVCWQFYILYLQISICDANSAESVQQQPAQPSSVWSYSVCLLTVLYTPQPLYNTIVGVQDNFHVSYPKSVITRVKCIGYIAKGILNCYLESNSDQCNIQDRVIMNRVIKRFRCIIFTDFCMWCQLYWKYTATTSPTQYCGAVQFVCRQFYIQATLFISKSRGPDKILRVISSLR